MENSGHATNGKAESRFSGAQKTAEDILHFLSEGAPTRLPQKIGHGTFSQFGSLHETPNAFRFPTPQRYVMGNSSRPNSPKGKSVPISSEGELKQEVQISVAGASIRKHASLGRVPMTGEANNRKYSFKPVTMKHPQSRNVIYVSPKTNCSNKSSNLTTEQDTSNDSNRLQNLSSQTSATSDELRRGESSERQSSSFPKAEIVSNCQGDVQFKGQSLLSDRPRKVISLSVGHLQKQNIIHRSTMSLLSLIKNSGNRLVVQTPQKMEEQTDAKEKKDAGQRQLSKSSLPTAPPTNKELPPKRKSSEKLIKPKKTTNRADFLPSIPNADDIQRHLQATISMTSFQPFADGSNSSSRNQMSDVAANDAEEGINIEEPSHGEDVDSDGIFEEETSLLLDDSTAVVCQPKRQKDPYINNCYLMYAVNVLARKWEEYITTDRQTLYDLECQSARENYSKESADMIADRGRYVWQLIDEMEPVSFKI